MTERRIDPRLLALACAGDKEAFGLLIGLYQPLALRVALRMVRDYEIARELSQEALLQAYLSLDQLRESTRFASWFYGIVLNVCRSYLRRQKLAISSLEALLEETSAEEALFAGGGSDPLELAEAQELQTLMLQAIQNLTPRNRAVTLLFYYGQLSLREVASHLHISVVAVKSRLQQARKELREQLLLIYPELELLSKKPELRRRAMKILTIVDVIQLEPYSLAILLETDSSPDAPRALPVWIGYWEGQAIISALQNLRASGPLSYSLLLALLQASGSELEEVRIENLREETLYAAVRVRVADATQTVEAHPSDALALVALAHCPLLVADELLERLGLPVTLTDGKLAQAELERIVQQLKSRQPHQRLPQLTTSGVGYKLRKQPENLDFSQGTDAWTLAGNHSQNYDCGVDSQQDAPSLYVKAKLAETGGFGALLQMFDAEAYRGKLIRFSGQVRGEAVDPRAMLCIYAYGIQGVQKAAFNSGGPIQGTSDGWQPCETTVLVPTDCVRIGMGLLLSGSGQVWLSKARFEVMTEDKAISSPARRPSQLPNLDFARGLEGWENWGGIPYHYTYALDQQVRYQGTPSLSFASRDAQAEGQLFVFQRLPAEPYHGARVRFSGQIKAQDVATWGGLCLTVFGTGGGVIINSNVQQDPTHNLRIVGSQDWQPYAIVLDIPSAGVELGIGLGLMGRGQLWLAAVRFEPVDQTVPTTIANSL